MSPLQLAWANLTQQRFRTVLSVVGVAFAVLLVFMQLGFLDGVMRTATQVYDKLDFDLLLTSGEYISMAHASTFSRERLGQARCAPGVESVVPLTATLAEWRDPRPHGGDPEAPRPRRSVMVLAVDPASFGRLFRDPVGTVFASADAFAAAAEQLARLDTVLFDRRSRKEYGDLQRWARDPGNELSGRQVQVAGIVDLGTGFAYNGQVMTSEATLTRVTGWPPSRVSFGLIKLRRGADPAAVRDDLRQLLGSEVEVEPGKWLRGEVEVYTRAQLLDKERNYWLTRTAVGQFFLTGVLIALLVGGVFVYQMMAADIARRLPEYATVRALGYRRYFLSLVVFWQGLFLALVGYVPGLALALLGYAFTEARAGAPIVMTLPRAAGVFGLAVVMCMGSALVAVRGVHRANPADLF